MISDWRSQWSAYSGQTDPIFPFGFVMLSTWDDTANTTCGNGEALQSCPVAAVRWAQYTALFEVPNASPPNTFMAVAVDWGDATSPYDDIHPRYKQQVASRLANAGLAVVYGYDYYWTGPMAARAVSDGSTITVSFAACGAEGLFIKNRNYVHFEAGDALNIWVCGLFAASLLNMCEDTRLHRVLERNVRFAEPHWPSSPHPLQLVHGAVRACSGASAVRGLLCCRTAAGGSVPTASRISLGLPCHKSTRTVRVCCVNFLHDTRNR
jgi:hypothetical protein